MNILNYVLQNLANDGRSASSAKKIIELTKKGYNSSSISEVVHFLEKNNARTLNEPLILKYFKKAPLIFIISILPFYYLLTGLALLPYFFLGIFRGKEYERMTDIDCWETLFKHWGKSPNCFLIKAIESLYFRSEYIKSPSLEIGVYRGDTSKAIFHNRRINVGMEFVPLHLFHFASQSTPVHDHLLSGDIYDIPFNDETFSSVFVVHSLDDIQRGIKGALSECSRVLSSPGGKLVFSTYSGYFGDQNLLLRILKWARLRALAEKLFNIIYVGTCNIFKEKEWIDLLKEKNLQVERFVYFFPISAGILFDIPFRLEGYLMNIFNFQEALYIFTRYKFLRKLYKKVLMKVICGIWSVSFDRSGHERPGINIFVVARKETNDSMLPTSSTKSGFDYKNALICPICKSGLKFYSVDSLSSSTQEQDIFACSVCGNHFPCVSGMPILLKTACFTK